MFNILMQNIELLTLEKMTTRIIYQTNRYINLYYRNKNALFQSIVY